jgi:phage tail-like protein
MAGFHPPVGFHFKVEVLDLPPKDNDVRFTEVGGLMAEIATEEMAEGGENRFIQRYPVRAKYPELVLKRGFFRGSEIAVWIRNAVENFVIEPKNVDVKLLNEDHEPLFTWHLALAYPTKWAVSDLNASANAVVVETLQLSYQYFTVDRGS